MENYDQEGLNTINQGTYDEKNFRQGNNTTYKNGFRRSYINKARQQFGSSNNKYIPCNTLENFNYNNKVYKTGGKTKRYNPIITNQNLPNYKKFQYPAYQKQRSYYQNTGYATKQSRAVRDRIYNKSFDNYYLRSMANNNQLPPINQNQTIDNQKCTRNFTKSSEKYDNAMRNDLYTNTIKNNNEQNSQESPKVDNKINTAKVQVTENYEPRLNTVQCTNYCGYIPRRRITFRKGQIFNNYKPFLVDDFNKFSDYY